MQRIPFPLPEAAEKHGDHPALIGDDRAITYAEFYRLVNATAGYLSQRGIEREDRLGIIANSSIEYILLLTALFQIGAVACPISPRFPEKTIAAMLDKINCTKIVTDLHHISDSYNGTIMELSSLLSRPKMSANTVGSPEFELNQDATIMFTSGSSAVPKAVLHTFAHHYYSALGANENMPLRPNDRWLLSLPLYHVGGMGILFRCLLSAATVVVPAPNDMPATAINRHKATHVSLVPTQLKSLLDETDSEQTPNCLRSVLLGGSLIPHKLIIQAHQKGLKLYTTYGLTETASQVTTTALDDPPEKLFTSGRILAHREIKISKESEILVRGKTCFKGYVEKDRLITPFDAEGWFGTSDLGDIDQDGYLTVTGRRDNMFISGGENIQPEEIEGVLARLPAIEDVMVVPVPSDKYGHRPVAFVKLQGGQKMNPESIISYLEDYLPRFKIPDRLYEWPDSIDQSGLKPNRRYFVRLAEKMSQTEPSN
ncbi:MAG: o-succinylbenzoate--CoA ligase [Candidatus Desulfatibia sp.]|uniref:o-succinylbenzoate--CoA ligase n=1 Tax=Candidatus Desulfatibia sp. TaxID=3101189 RepID=UPI002F309E8E